jgi:hypothetical protein
MENRPDHARTMRNGSGAMIALGVLLFVLSLVYLIPHDMGVTSALRRRGALDLFALAASVVMTLLGLAVHLTYRWFTRARPNGGLGRSGT